MCKVMMIPGIKPGKLPQVYSLAKSMAKVMSRVEEDGVGYAAITKDGNIYGEKWLNKDDAFVIHATPKPDPGMVRIANLFGDVADWDKVPSTAKVYDSFGQRTQPALDSTVAMILHARKSTVGAKTIENVHPFVERGDEHIPATALIHNGGILNHDKLTKKMSTCDSEVILHEYLANSMYHNPWGMEQLAKTLVGGYTVGLLSSMLIDNVWTPYLDIFKSHKDLEAAFVPELDTVVFSTTKWSLEEALKECGMTGQNWIKVKDGFLLRINAITGERVDDPIPFTLSSQFNNAYNNQHQHSMVRSQPRDVGPNANPASGDGVTASETSVAEAKRHFERMHPTLFTTPYLEISSNLTPEEKAYYAELEKDKKIDHQALRLVSAAMNARS